MTGLVVFGPTLNVHVGLALICDFFLSSFFLVAVRLLMVLVYDYIKRARAVDSNKKRIFIYSTSERSIAAVTALAQNTEYQMEGFISDSISGTNLKLINYPIISVTNFEVFQEECTKHHIYAILFPTADDAKAEANNVIKYCADCNLKSLVIPSINDIIDGKTAKNQIREVQIEDLLGRKEIQISMYEIRKNFSGKTIMVTGAAGSIGSELCRQLAALNIKRLVLFDNGETPMHNLRLELEARFPDLDFIPIIGDVRYIERLDFAFRHYHPQIIFHAAAYKHVPLMEENPCEAITVNVKGTRNLANKAIEYKAEMMVMISTDKAVNPTNVMGCSKRLAEIYVQSLGLKLATEDQQNCMTKFVTTRFGNVLGSNGSVIPRFREQIANGGPVTVTHPDITRFFMTIPEACRLVMEAATMNISNRIFVFDMGESVKIDNLAKRMIELSGLKLGTDIQIEYTGLRPGEKLYEEVLSNKENTEPTPHDRIRIAKVREYNYDEVTKTYDELIGYAKEVNIPELIKLMKKIVPEYISKNSEFEKYDKIK